MWGKGGTIEMDLMGCLSLLTITVSRGQSRLHCRLYLQVREAGGNSIDGTKQYRLLELADKLLWTSSADGASKKMLSGMLLVMAYGLHSLLWLIAAK